MATNSGDNLSSKAKKGRLAARGSQFTDRESAMRHMRFQGHIRAPGIAEIKDIF